MAIPMSLRVSIVSILIAALTTVGVYWGLKQVPYGYENQSKIGMAHKTFQRQDVMVDFMMHRGVNKRQKRHAPAVLPAMRTLDTLWMNSVYLDLYDLYFRFDQKKLADSSDVMGIAIGNLDDPVVIHQNELSEYFTFHVYEELWPYADHQFTENIPMDCLVMRAKPEFLDLYNEHMDQWGQLPYLLPISLLLGLCMGMFVYRRGLRFSWSWRALVPFATSGSTTTVHKPQVQWGNGFRIGAFVLIILIPVGVQVLGLESEGENLENRELAEEIPLNKFYWELWPGMISEYYADAFGYRSELVSQNAILKKNLFRASTIPGVVLGEDDWMYLGRRDHALEDYINQQPYTEAQLQREAQELIARHDSLKALGISYYHTFFPNKHSIYPEHLPQRVHFARRDTLSRAEQMMAYLKQVAPDYPIIDLRDSLRAQKGQGQLYFKMDSHWNELGAYYAYRAFMYNLMAEDSAQFTPAPLEEFSVEWRPVISSAYPEQDMLDIIGIGNFRLLGIQDTTYVLDSLPLVRLMEPDSVALRRIGWANKPFSGAFFYLNDTQARRAPKVLFFRDSMSKDLAPFISHNFRKSSFMESEFSWEVVSRLKPTMVVVAYVERNFQ